MKKILAFSLLATLFFSACTGRIDDEMPNNSTANLRFQFEFDENQQRLNNIGQPAEMPEGNAGQTPDFNGFSVHLIELVPNRFTSYGGGEIVYKGAENETGGTTAIDFDKAIVEEAGQVFLEIPISEIPADNYEYIRVSASYQNYDVVFNIRNVPFLGDALNQKATVASFLGYNTYISSITPRSETLTVNDDKLQGFWAFETDFDEQYAQYNQLSSGEAPAGATTVVNPLAGTVDIPAGSCVITGEFMNVLEITGTETEDKTITLSFSTQNSFEWIDHNGNGELDFYAEGSGENEPIVDMGLRGLEPRWE